MTHPQPIFWLNANGTFFVGDGDGVQAFTSDAQINWSAVSERLDRLREPGVGLVIDTGGLSIPDHVLRCLDEAILVIDEYYNGDRGLAEVWLLKAHEANKDISK